MPDMTKLLIICPLVFLAGLIDSVAGGGGLISLPAYLAAGLPPHAALACNKFSSCCGTFVSCYRYIKNKKADVKAAAVSIVGALIGSAAGAQAVLHVDATILKYLLLAVIPLIAVVVLVKKDFGRESKVSGLSAKTVFVLCAVIGLGLGFYDGFFGPGTGTFLILAFTAIMGFDIVTASGNAKLVNQASNLASLIVFLLHGDVIFMMAIPAALCNIAGNFIGSGLALKNGAKIIRPMFVVALTLLVMYIAKDLFWPMS